MLPIIFISCSSDDDNPIGSNPEDEPVLVIEPIEIPEALQNSNSPGAQRAVMYMSMANSFTAFSAFMSPPPGNSALQKTNGVEEDWEHTWTDGTLSITMRVYESGGYNYWTTTLNGTDGNTVYTNWLMLEARQTMDASSGYLKMFDDNTTDLTFNWEWATDPAGNVTMSMSGYEDGVAAFLIEVVANADESGNTKFYEPISSLIYDISWTSNGNGTYTQYDRNGNVVDSGSW